MMVLAIRHRRFAVSPYLVICFVRDREPARGELILDYFYV